MKTKGRLVLCPAPPPGQQAPSPPPCGPRRPHRDWPCHSGGLAETPRAFMPRKEALFPGLSGLEGGSLAPLVVNSQQRDCENTSLKELKGHHFPPRALANTGTPQQARLADHHLGACKPRLWPHETQNLGQRPSRYWKATLFQEAGGGPAFVLSASLALFKPQACGHHRRVWLFLGLRTSGPRPQCSPQSTPPTLFTWWVGRVGGGGGPHGRLALPASHRPPPPPQPPLESRSLRISPSLPPQ